MKVKESFLMTEDVNTCTDTGLYCYNHGGAGVPTNAPESMEIFVLEVLNTGISGGGANIIIQKAYNYDMRIAIRIKFTDKWRDWKYI